MSMCFKEDVLMHALDLERSIAETFYFGSALLTICGWNDKGGELLF